MSKNSPHRSPENNSVDQGRRSLLRGGVAAGLLSGVGVSTLTACGGGSVASGWQPKRTVIVILENKSFADLIGNTNNGALRMPYLNQLAAASALMTKSYAAPTPYNIIPVGGVPKASDSAGTPLAIASVPSDLSTVAKWTKGAQFSHFLPARGSQTNYLYQFAGHNQGILPDWFQQANTGRAANSTSAPAFQNEFGELLVDSATGDPKPSFTGNIGLSNEFLTSPAFGLSLPFTTPNLGAAIIGKGLSFATFSESLPYPSFNGRNTMSGSDPASENPNSDSSPSSSVYSRRHNPAINWINFYNTAIPADKQRFVLPKSCNLAFVNTVDPDGTKYPGFALDKNGAAASYDQLPTVSLVVPNNNDNIHNSSSTARESADVWLQTNIKPYADWAAANDSLLIITTDEDGFSDATNGVANVGTDKYFGGASSYMYGMDNITTLFFGPSTRIKAGSISRRVDHLNVLATVLSMYGVLDAYKADFATAWGASTHPIKAGWTAGANPVRQAELSNQLAGLTPITDILA